MTGAERVLAELRSGPKTAAELYARTYCVVHSRISQLRSQGHVIELERIGGTGAGSYLYRLLGEGGGLTADAQGAGAFAPLAEHPEPPRPDPSRRGAYSPPELTEAGVVGRGSSLPLDDAVPGQLSLTEDVAA